MKAYSKYELFQNKDKPTRYVLKNVYGIDILQDVLDVYKTGLHAGKRHLGFAKSGSEKAAKKYEKSLLGKRNITGLTFGLKHPNKAWGDFGNDCILLEFSDNGQSMTLYFIKGHQNTQKGDIQEWLDGELLEAIDSELLPLNKKAVN